MTVNKILGELDLKLTHYTQALLKQDELVNQQEEIIIKKMEDSKEIINWYSKKNFNFTHPTITEFNTSRGPILGLNKESNELIFLHVNRGIIKLNIRTGEEKDVDARWLVENGCFNEAISGLDYLHNMLDEYLKSLKKQIGQMEHELEDLQ
ncbi:hypothetical protein ACIQ6U_03700 [Lysinibacillus fusiformis]|uniref:hypothetical protein n=1 Tax=Lysinibacillus fusiformis TaxID=28031 RepID=UPI0037FB0E19